MGCPRCWTEGRQACEGAGGFTLFTQAHGAPGFVAVWGAQPHPPSSYLQPALSGGQPSRGPDHLWGSSEAGVSEARFTPSQLWGCIPDRSPEHLPAEVLGPRWLLRGPARPGAVASALPACFLTLGGQPALGETCSSVSGAVRPAWAGAARWSREQVRGPQLGPHPAGQGHLLTPGPGGHGVLLSRAWGGFSYSY